jgi:hypothetical protein
MGRSECGIPEPETLIAAVLYLATNYARTGCPMLCAMLVRQLTCIRNHPSDSVSPSFRETCSKLLVEWGRIGAERAQALHEAAHGDGADAQQLH